MIAGVVTHLAESEREEIQAAPTPVVETPDDLVDALTFLITLETGPRLPRTRARFTLYLEGATTPDILAPLLAQRAVFVEWTTSLLERVGAADPTRSVRTLMAAADGLVLHRATIDPDAPVRPVIERAVRACLD